MKTSKLILLLSLVAIATVAAHAGKPTIENAFIETSPQDDKPDKSEEKFGRRNNDS